MSELAFLLQTRFYERMNDRGQRFLQMLNERVLLGDGAVGTLLLEKGISGDISYEELNLSRPDIVRGINAEYVAAGADVIETNSFCANALKQKRYGLEGKVREMARTSARLARDVAGENCFVAGSIGPLARRRTDLDEFSDDEILGFFRESMEALVEGGADLLILETFTVLREMELALRAGKKLDVPVICQMAFGEGGTTELGVRAETAARKLADIGADVIGSNCRSGPHILISVVERQASAVDLPISVYPNAGYAEQRDGRYVYGASPEYFAERVRDLVAAGANLIGGCCGTTPAHIRAMKMAVAGLQPIKRKKVGKKIVVVEDERAPERIGGKKFLSLLGGERPFVTVEFDPPKGISVKEAFDGARRAVSAGADAINIPDNSLANVRMDNVVFAQLMRERVETPVILHLTCRDKNLIALQSDILGAQAAGIDAILAVTGDPASLGDQPGASSVYDINSIGLVETIAGFNRAVTPWGETLDQPTDMAIGVAVNPNVSGPKGLEGALFKLRKKISAGAQFAETQPIYDPEILRKLLEQRSGIQIPVCIGLMPIVSERNAEFLHNEVPGIRIPKETIARFKGLGRKEGEERGLAIARELIDIALAAGARHFYLVPPLHRYDVAIELVKHIRGTHD